MANVLNKLLEICEILDTKGGSGGGSTGGGSGGGSTSGEINFKRFRQEFQNTDLKDTNSIYHLVLGLYDSGSNDSIYGNLSFGLYTITIEGNKYLSLKITNNEITTANYILSFNVFGIDTNTSEDNEYTVIRYTKDQASQYNEQSITNEPLPNYISIYQNDGVLGFS